MRTKVTIIVLIASMVIFLFVESITFKFEFKRYQNQISELTISTSQLISDYYGLLLFDNEKNIKDCEFECNDKNNINQCEATKNDVKDDLKMGLHDFSKISFVYDAFIVDNNGKIYTEYHKSKDTIVHQIYNNSNKISCYENGFIHVTLPILHDEKIFGKMYVRSFLNTKDLKYDLLKWTIIIIVMQTIFAFIVIYMFHHYISNPIQYLIEITRQIIEDKNYKRRIQKKNFDEIGKLYDEFNNLLDTITLYGEEKSSTSNELVKSNERYKGLVDNIPGVVFQIIYDGKWKVQVLGEGVTELTDGLSVDYFLGKDEKPISKILSPESQNMLFERISKGIGNNKEFESIYTVVTKTGRQKWILVKGRFGYNNETGITSIEGVLFDQTEKILAQELLKKTEKRYHDLFENLNDAAFLIDLETDFIVETNKEGEKLLGLHRTQIVDKLQKKMLCKQSDSLKSNTDSFEELGNMFDFYAEIENHEMFIPVHVRSSIIEISEKKHMLCLVRDISERIEYEKNLKLAKEKAEESDRLKSMFLSNMSHEIRTPLNGFIGFSKLILSSKSLEETESYISIIDGCGKQLIRIIDDILDISRIETGQMAFYFEQFNVNILLDEVKLLIEEQLVRTNKTNISVVLEKGLFDGIDLIYSDRHRLFQVLSNLAGNAAKFTDEGQIQISYKPLKNSTLEFVVKDTGIGLSNEKKDIIFNRFTQADSSIAPKYGGSGLGLAISKGIVELMGGEIWYNSEIGKGSEFYFTVKNNKK